MNRLPIEIQNNIWNMYYKNIYTNNVITELKKYNEKISEYWAEEEFVACLNEWEIVRLRKLDPDFGNRECPYLLKNHINTDNYTD